MKKGKKNKNSGVKEELFRSRKAKNGGSSSFDVLYQLSYMSVLAAAGAPRDRVFELSSQLDCGPAEHFKRVELTRSKLGYDYARVCHMVGESTEDMQMKSLLLRFSNSLISGESEATFLTREAEAQAKSFENEYSRKMESLKRWTDAYISLVLSAVLVVIIGSVSSMLWKMEPIVIFALAGICIVTTAGGVGLLYMMTPKELVILNLKEGGSREQKLVKKLAKVLIPVTVILDILILISGANFGLVLILTAALILPIGFVGAADEKKITKRDAEVGPFLRSLGGVCAAMGTTTKDALSRVGLDSVLALKAEVSRLHTRLLTGIRARLCWQKFKEETGSELTNRSVNMFYDAIEVGGDPEQAGYHASLFANRVAMLRATRKTTSDPFRWLCITMHAAVVALLVFIIEVISTFGDLVASAEKNMPNTAGTPAMTSFTSFNFSGLSLIHRFVVPLVLVFTVSDALAPSIVDGGSKYKFLYNLGITAAISGVALIFLPKISGMLFNSLKTS